MKNDFWYDTFVTDYSTRAAGRSQKGMLNIGFCSAVCASLFLKVKTTFGTGYAKEGAGILGSKFSTKQDVLNVTGALRKLKKKRFFCVQVWRSVKEYGIIFMLVNRTQSAAVQQKGFLIRMKVNMKRISKLPDTAPCWCGSGKPYAACHKAEDDRLEELRRTGHKVPSRKMIKTPEQILGCREAGRINSLVLDAVSANIREGMTTQEIDDIVAARTRELGGTAATLGFEGFPASVCTSVNNVVCHGIPNTRTVLHSGDIVNVDCTTIYNGYFGDASRMYCIGGVAPEARKLVEVTKESIELALKHLTPYCHLGDIGYYVNLHARQNGYHVVREIGGHGVGLAMHEDPYVCHIGQLHKGLVLAPGMIFTIEPMINAGTAAFYEDAHDGWTVYTADGSLSAQWEYEILMTETGYEILSK